MNRPAILDVTVIITFCFLPKIDPDELRENGWQCGQTTIYIPTIYVCDEHLDCEAGSDETDDACTALPGQKLFVRISL